MLAAPASWAGVGQIYGLRQEGDGQVTVKEGKVSDTRFETGDSD